MPEIITSVELTDAETARFSAWLMANKADNVELQACVFEALDKIRDALASGEAPWYELGQFCTSTKRAELFKFDESQLLIETETEDA